MKIIKCLLVGDENVGKTSLVTKYIMENLPSDDKYIPTTHETCVYTYLKGSNDKIVLELWDTSGSSNYDTSRQLSYEEADVILICFSIVSGESFENVESKWLPEVQSCCPNVPICLVGLKSDLIEDKEIRDELFRNNKEPILHFEGLELAHKIRAYKYCECSAKTGYKLQEVFNKAAGAAMQKQYSMDLNFWEDHEDNIWRCNDIY